MPRSYFKTNESAETLVLVYTPISTWRRRKKHVLASPSRDSYPFTFLNKFQFSYLTASHTFGRSCLTPYFHHFRSLPSSFKNTKQPSELRHFHTATNCYVCEKFYMNMDEKLEPIAGKYVRDFGGILLHVFFFFTYSEPITKRQKQ